MIGRPFQEENCRRVASHSGNLDKSSSGYFTRVLARNKSDRSGLKKRPVYVNLPWSIYGHLLPDLE